MLPRPKTLFIITALIVLLLVVPSVWAQSTTHITKNAVPSVPTLPNSRYVAIQAGSEPFMSSYAIWVLDTYTGQVQAYRIVMHQNGQSWIEHLPINSELPAPNR
jgi:hypothetical protein